MKALANTCSRATVLYVEDHPVNALLMSALFESRPDLRLVIADTGTQAMDLAKQMPLQLLLLDLNLPDCHGSQLLTQLRQLRGCAQLPAVAVTADVDFNIVNTGFAELWPKPLDLARVLARLQFWAPPRLSEQLGEHGRAGKRMSGTYPSTALDRAPPAGLFTSAHERPLSNAQPF